MTMVLRYVLTAVIAYLFGSVSTGMLVSRLMGGPNLREVGSGNTGATNALRAMGVKGGAAVFVGDILKAVIACVIGRFAFGLGLNGAMLAGVFVVLGHNWPVFFQFKGGKGVSSTVGAMFVCFPWQATICYLVTIGVIAITRLVSLGSLLMVVLFIVLIAVTNWGNWLAIAWTVVMAALCFARHHANIKRLLNGTERKLGQKNQQA